MKITLKSGRKIGDGCPPYIVGEIGSNWLSLDDCLKSIRMAKLAGADAVKFQAFTREALYGQISNDMSGELPLDWLPKLKACADEHKIDFLCSAFSPELIEAVDPYVEIHKVASSEACHVRMLEKLREIGKPVILSCGGKGEADIGNSLEVLGDTPTIICYCVAAYPAREIDLRQITLLEKRFGLPVGYSDHSLDVLTIPKCAALAGACVIEKHVTFIDAETPDSPHSLNFDQFKRMVETVNKAECDPIGYTREESDMIKRHNRRLIVTHALQPGDELMEGVNFGIYRSLKDDTKGLSPFHVDRVNGKRVKVALQAGDSIGPEDA
jgi:sialic acid synthase SpsE